MSSANFYNWRSKYGGMDASMMSRLKELELENRRLKKMYAESQMQTEILKEAFEKSSKAVKAPGSRKKGGIKDIVQYYTLGL